MSEAFDALVAELEKDGGLDEARAWIKNTFYTADGKVKEDIFVEAVLPSLIVASCCIP